MMEMISEVALMELSEKLGAVLVEKGLKLATAESCTGGYIAHLLTAVPGASRYFEGGVVAYSNGIKEEILNVVGTDIDEYGAVSIPVVEQMARGAIAMMETDVAIATSGIAGPTGGSKQKPVGTVCIAVATEDSVQAQQFYFTADRQENIRLATQAALNMALQLLQQIG